MKDNLRKTFFLSYLLVAIILGYQLVFIQTSLPASIKSIPLNEEEQLVFDNQVSQATKNANNHSYALISTVFGSDSEIIDIATTDTVILVLGKTHLGDGLFSINSSSTTQPEILAQYTDFLEDPLIALAVNGTKAYVVTNRYLFILGFSNPSTFYFGSQLILAGSILNYYCTDICLQGNYAFITNRDGGLYIVNISNPTSPSITFKENYFAEYEFGEAGCVNKEYTMCYCKGLKGAYTYDVSDKASAVNTNIYLSGGRAVSVDYNESIFFIAEQNNGLAIQNVSIAENPQKIISYYNYGAPIDVKFKDNLLYLLIDDKGFEIVDISNLSNPIQKFQFNVGT